jgi:hypothetical protein
VRVYVTNIKIYFDNVKLKKHMYIIILIYSLVFFASATLLKFGLSYTI